MRLDKFLADMKLGTRNDVKKLIKNKLITINDKVITASDYKVKCDDVVKFKDEIINYVKYEYYLLNKPKGYVCANDDNMHPTVFKLINSKRKDLFTVGRLDKDTTGALLITNDGKLCHDLISPNKHVDKVYHVKLLNKLEENQIKQFESPIQLSDFITKVSKLEKINNYEAYLTISEGKYHQVKRMFEHVGNKVVELDRVKFSFLTCDNLDVSNYRHLTQDEIDKLKNL